jgi:hypothetical protein
VIGAWDVFDVVDGDTTYGFATPQGDALFVANLESGIDAMLAEGRTSPCWRWPACGLRTWREPACVRFPNAVTTIGWNTSTNCSVASPASYQAAGFDRVQFVEGPDEWCGDETIATDLGYRWDGVHVYRARRQPDLHRGRPDLLRLAAV